MGLGGQYYVYLLTNQGNSVLYTGVTNDLIRRVYEHKNRLKPGFASHYGVDRLVYFEVYEDIEAAITREKQIKAGPRRKKIALIDGMNPDWRDLYEEIVG
ncbi:MAG: GIY-YIG nuclease family protein [Thermodesulfobacteriota bacterium]